MCLLLRHFPLWEKLWGGSFSSSHIQCFYSFSLRCIPGMAVPFHHLPGHVTGKRHNRVIRGLPISQPRNENVPKVMQAAFDPGQLSARPPCNLPAPDWFFGVSVPHGHGSVFVSVLAVQPISL